MRDRLIAELEGLGLAPVVQSRAVEVPLRDGSVLMHENEAGEWVPLVLPLDNVLVRVPGSEGEYTALLMAHYDSRPGAPGAGDDAAAVAALLESLRSLVRSDVPPRNDVIVLFDDGEEYGLLGARLFADEHRWAEEVDAVFNFEGRGNGGPSILFETGDGSGALVEAFARLAPRPVGTSLAPAVYRRLPNDTSFSVFRDRGVPGLNFAYVGGVTAYHHAIDTPENLRVETLQHQAEAVRACVEIAARGDLGAPASPDPVFFNLPGAGLVRYPVGWGLAASLAAILVALVALRGVGRPDARAFLGLAGFAAWVAGGVWVVWGVVWWGTALLARALRTVGLLEAPAERGNLESSRLCALAVFALALAWAAARVGRLRRREDGADRLRGLAGAGLAAGALALLALQLALPEGAYALTWALPCAAFGLLVLPRGDTASTPRIVAAALAPVPAALVAAPALHLLFLTTATRPWRAVGIEAVLLAFGAALFVPWLRLLSTRVATTLAAAAGLALLVTASWVAANGS